MSRKTKSAKATKATKVVKRKKPKKVRKPSPAPVEPRHTREPTAPLRKICSTCHETHEGNSEESFDSLAGLDPEAVVYYDRDVVGSTNVNGLCGPRFRQNSVGLYAHYGSPGGANYVVYQWKLDDKRWVMIIEVPDREDADADADAAAGGAP